jgi:rsbT antagonist protein RsbS
MERIPILRMGRFLLVTIQVDMHDQLALTLQDDLTQRIVNDRAKGVLIDISSLDVVDSFIGRMISNIAAMARVLDAHTVVVGMQPAVAITLVELGLTLDGVRTALNVERGMALLQAATERPRPLARARRPLDRGSTELPLAQRRGRRAPAQPRARARDRRGPQPGRPDQVRHRGERARPQHHPVRRRGRGPRAHREAGERRGVRLEFVDQGPASPTSPSRSRTATPAAAAWALAWAAPSASPTNSTSSRSPGRARA